MRKSSFHQSTPPLLLLSPSSSLQPTAAVAVAAPPLVTALGLSAAAPAPAPIGFTGLFFRCASGSPPHACYLVRLTDALARSTFFGGHEPKYATPRDQFTWFKDFAMTANA